MTWTNIPNLESILITSSNLENQIKHPTWLNVWICTWNRSAIWFGWIFQQQHFAIDGFAYSWQSIGRCLIYCLFCMLTAQLDAVLTPFLIHFCIYSFHSDNTIHVRLFARSLIFLFISILFGLLQRTPAFLRAQWISCRMCYKPKFRHDIHSIKIRDDDKNHSWQSNGLGRTHT